VANPTIWFQAAGQPYSGKFTVTEGFVETVVPLAKNTGWAKSLDLNAAVRATGYSTFGSVATWKVGTTWQITDSIRFRGMQSRNIREPTLVDLYLGGTTNQGFFADPANNNAQITSRTTTKGNPNLQPEKSNETDLGIVLQPTFFPGFNVSFDYYRIGIDGAVNTPSLTQLVTLCVQGNQVACSTFSRSGSGTSTLIVGNLSPQNFATETEKGFDIEASYVLPMAAVVDSWDGKLSARFLATHYISYITNSGLPGDIPVENAGVNARNGLPSWRYDASLGYSLDPFNVGLKIRAISSGLISATAIECTSGCPASTALHQTVSNNHMDGAVYVDLNFGYKINVGEAATSELFLNVRNIANKDPALMATSPAPATFPANQGLYDVMGRVFRAGIRFKM
jgi:outer membrane receptor protein involved in Fe transport